MEQIRSVALELVPEAEEIISYGLPTIKYKGQYVIYFGAFKDPMSVFPGAGSIHEIAKKLEGFKIAKGTIQFTEAKPIPDEIVKLLVKKRMAALSAPKS